MTDSASRRRVLIRLADGTPINRYRSVPSWRQTLRGPIDVDRNDAEAVSVDALLSEAHHHQYGKPWAVGRYYFSHLKRRGLKPSNAVLDIGCGAGRVGIWLVGYLEKARYFGVDSHLASLVAFAHYELPLHDLVEKNPHLLLDNRLEVGAFSEQFDMVLDLSVTTILAKRQPDLVASGYKKIRASMRLGARLFMISAPAFGIEQMAEIGLSLDRTDEVAYPLLALSSREWASSNLWHEFTAV